jgi:hypothetical protein
VDCILIVSCFSSTFDSGGLLPDYTALHVSRQFSTENLICYVTECYENNTDLTARAVCLSFVNMHSMDAQNEEWLQTTG